MYFLVLNCQLYSMCYVKLQPQNAPGKNAETNLFKSIPVGCVPPAFVVLGVGYISPWIPYPRMSYLLDALPQIHYSPWIPYLYPLDTLPLSPVYPTPTPRRNMGPEIPYPPRKDMRQEICYPTPWTEQRALVKTIPSRNFVGGRYKNPPEQRAICTAQAEGFAIGDSEVVVKNKATI